MEATDHKIKVLYVEETQEVLSIQAELFLFFHFFANWTFYILIAPNQMLLEKLYLSTKENSSNLRKTSASGIELTEERSSSECHGVCRWMNLKPSSRINTAFREREKR